MRSLLLGLLGEWSWRCYYLATDLEIEFYAPKLDAFALVEDVEYLLLRYGSGGSLSVDGKSLNGSAVLRFDECYLRAGR